MFVGPPSDPDKYRLMELRSPGAEGQLWRAENVAYGMPVALKIINAAHEAEIDKWRPRWQRQVDLLKGISHPNLAKITEVFEGAEKHEAGQTGTGNSLYLAMDFEYGPSVPEWVAANLDRDALASIRLIADLAAAVDHLHYAGTTPVLHRDIKPQNVIVGPNGPVLVDFGFAREESNVEMTMVGTPGYIAPEAAAGHGVLTGKRSLRIRRDRLLLPNRRTPNTR